MEPNLTYLYHDCGAKFLKVGWLRIYSVVETVPTNSIQNLQRFYHNPGIQELYIMDTKKKYLEMLLSSNEKEILKTSLI